MQNDTVNWLIEWFEARGPLPDARGTALHETNYFEAGLIDSIDVIDLIAGIEDHFGIRFNEQHFQDRRFATIGGLAEIIEEAPTNG